MIPIDKALIRPLTRFGKVPLARAVLKELTGPCLSLLSNPDLGVGHAFRGAG